MKKQHNSVSFIAFIILISVLMCLFLPFNLTVSAESKKYLSLGDSIASGYGLKNIENERYASLLTKDLSKRGSAYELIDFAVDGMDSAGLLKLLSDTSNKELTNALQTASVITISIGGNNFLKPLMDIYSNMAESADSTGSGMGGDIGSMLDNPSQINMNMIIGYMNSLFKPGVKEYDDLIKGLNKGYEQFKSDIDKIIAILNKNKNAQIIFLTVYNPYNNFKQIKNFYDTAELYIGKINDVIKEKAPGNYKVSDANTSFKKSDQKLLNADLASFNMDPHPNSAGHKLIYKNIIHTLGFSIYFDDMAGDTWAVEYVDDLHELNIIFGTNTQKREFSPKAELKNCDLAVLLVRTLKLKITDADVADVKLPFSDANKIESYALNSVKACYKAGLYNQLYASGAIYEFGPQKSAQRIDVALMVVQLIDKSKWSNKKPVYTDLKGVDEAYYPALSTLYDYGIMAGSPDKTVNPFGGLTRAQVAKILWMILDNLELSVAKK
jgi:lysophospholipase L1-like esterase